MLEIFQNILGNGGAFFQSGSFATFLFVAKILSLIASVGLLAGSIIVFRKNWPLEHRLKPITNKPEKPIKTKVAVDLWINILDKAEKGTEQDLSFAIIEADKLVDAILKGGGFPGETMAERLKRIDEHQLKTINDLWRAHKIRNQIVHTPEFHIGAEEARNVLRDYQHVLEELEVI